MSEQFATLGTSTLNGAILSGATSLLVTSASTFSSSGTFRIRIDNELFKVTGVSGSTFTVVGAQEGTIAAVHSDLATVAQITTAAGFTQWQSDTLGLATQAAIPGGKLTLTSGTPVTTGDITAAPNVYYTPFRSNVVALWDGSYWQRYTFAELTLALGTVSAMLPYDVFLYVSAGVVAIEKLAWTSALVRATAISVQDGRYCKTGDKTRLYVGSFVTTSTTTTEDSETNPYLFNAYHAAPRRSLGPSVNTDFTSSSGTYVTIHTGFNTNVFTGLPQNVDVKCKSILRNSTDNACDAYLGVQIDGGTTYMVAVATNDKFAYYSEVQGDRNLPLSAGLHTFGLMWRMDGATQMALDSGSRGAVFYGTQISCVVVR